MDAPRKAAEASQTPVDGTRLRAGAAVEALDGPLGVVEQARVRPETGELVTLMVRHGDEGDGSLLPVAAAHVEEVTVDGRVWLRVSRAEAERHAVAIRDVAADGDASTRNGNQSLRVPVLAERLSVETRPVDLGELRLHKRVEVIEETIRQAVVRDELEVERVPVDRPLDAPAAQRTEGDWLVIPVMEEVLILRKQLMLKEELRIRTRRVTEEQEVREPVRHEHIELEDATRHGVRGVREAGNASAHTAGGERPAAEPAGRL